MKDISFKNIPTIENCYSFLGTGAFISKEENIDGTDIVTFSYRLANYGDFNVEFARNLRGITFNKKTGEILTLPFHKFFNFNECPFSEFENIKNKKIVKVREKADGSLIQFFMINNNLYSKTKMTCFSEQSAWAMEIINRNENLKKEIVNKIQAGFTPLFEFVSPRNRIVISYSIEELIYLGSRNNSTGEYDFTPLENCKNIYCYDVKEDINEVAEIVNNFEDKEGVVVVFEDGDMVKIKTKDYILLHKTKDNVLNENSLVELIITEKLDDIKSLFSEDENMIKYVNSMEQIVKTEYNYYINEAEKFYFSNKNLSRKDFAIKGQKELNKAIFSLAINLYAKNEIDYAKYNYKFISDKLWKKEDFSLTFIDKEDI